MAIALPLNSKQHARLTTLQANVQIAQQAYGIALGSILDTTDIDPATITDMTVKSGSLIVTRGTE